MLILLEFMVALISANHPKMCDCNDDVRYGYFMMEGIERKGMYCKKCGELLDYIPQY